MPPNSNVSSESEFQTALLRRAARLNTDLDGLVAADRELLQDFKYPGLDCFDPYEVEQFCRAELSEDRLAHSENCGSCAALLEEAGEPADDLIEKAILQSRQEKSLRVRQSKLASQRDRWIPLIELVFLQGCTIGAIIIAIAWIDRRNVMLSIAMAGVKNTFLITMLTLALISILPVFGGTVFGWIKQEKFRRFAGTLGGGAFVGAVVLCVVTASSTVTSKYRELSIAQQGLVKKFAEQGSRPWSYGSSFYNLSDLHGELVARTDTGEVSVLYFLTEKYENRKTLGTVYRSIISQSPDGVMAINTAKNGRKIIANTSLISPEPRKGDRVVAFVPARTNIVSIVYPVK